MIRLAPAVSASGTWRRWRAALRAQLFFGGMLRASAPRADGPLHYPAAPLRRARMLRAPAPPSHTWFATSCLCCAGRASRWEPRPGRPRPACLCLCVPARPSAFDRWSTRRHSPPCPQGDSAMLRDRAYAFCLVKTAQLMPIGTDAVCYRRSVDSTVDLLSRSEQRAPPPAGRPSAGQPSAEPKTFGSGKNVTVLPRRRRGRTPFFPEADVSAQPSAGRPSAGRLAYFYAPAAVPFFCLTRDCQAI
jgi:hypothetical protein